MYQQVARQVDEQSIMIVQWMDLFIQVLVINILFILHLVVWLHQIMNILIIQKEIMLKVECQMICITLGRNIIQQV